MMSVRALVLVAAVGCGGGGGFPDAREIDGPPPGGTFTAAWAVTNTNGQAITCDEIGAISVTAVLRNRAVQGGSTEVFTCGTQMGTSPAVAPGLYDISFELTGTSGLLATIPAQQAVVITSGGDVRLAPLTFAVEATGGLKLTLATNKPGGNCGLAANNGAQITQTTIALQHVGSGTCEPVTFTISAGANQPAGMYVVNCANPVVAGCIENDQQLTVTGVPSGSYLVHIRGKSGNDCWSNNDQLPVPPLGRDLTRTLNLGFQMAMPSC
jgi:hypothetical protein